MRELRCICADPMNELQVAVKLYYDSNKLIYPETFTRAHQELSSILQAIDSYTKRFNASLRHHAHILEIIRDLCSKIADIHMWGVHEAEMAKLKAALKELHDHYGPSLLEERVRWVDISMDYERATR
jgi:hypothetical protein